jgi:hypothetical protein
MKEFRGATALGAVCASLFTLPIAAASAQTPGTPEVVSRSEQAARDGERVRILQQELAREHARAVEAVRHRAERLAARDADAVRDAERALARTNENMAALRREIATTNLASATAGALPKPATPTVTYRAASLSDPLTRADAPWWDVYAQPRRRDATAASIAAAAPAERPRVAAPTSLRTTED